jgi:hypothetical protein
LALAVPLSRFTPRVGGGSAFFVRRYGHCRHIFDRRHERCSDWRSGRVGRGIVFQASSELHCRTSGTSYFSMVACSIVGFVFDTSPKQPASSFLDFCLDDDNNA